MNRLDELWLSLVEEYHETGELSCYSRLEKINFHCRLWVVKLLTGGN